MSTLRSEDEQFAGRTLRAARRRAQLSQRGLALAAGVSPSVVCAYETGARQPSAKMLSRLVRATGGRLRVVEPDEELHRKKVELELAIGTASGLPRRPRGALDMPPFLELVGG